MASFNATQAAPVGNGGNRPARIIGLGTATPSAGLVDARYLNTAVLVPANWTPPPSPPGGPNHMRLQANVAAQMAPQNALAAWIMNTAQPVANVQYMQTVSRPVRQPGR